MNPGIFTGISSGAVGGAISRYIQTPTITSSQILAVPRNTQRIEALLVGGGGSGGSYSGGGFGGAAIIEIPVTGSPLNIVIGAGGISGPGSSTYVSSAQTIYGLVGGGGAGDGVGAQAGGSGGGNVFGGFNVGAGGNPPIGKLLWSIYPQVTSVLVPTQASNTSSPNNIVIGLGGFVQYTGGPVSGSPGVLGAGSSGTSLGGTSPFFGGGGSTAGTTGRTGGSGGGGAGGSSISAAGGSLTSVSIWGYTGKAGGSAGSVLAGGGGGGLLGAGTQGGIGSQIGGAGGNGGGGGGGGGITPGNGGNGFAVIRFYM